MPHNLCVTFFNSSFFRRMECNNLDYISITNIQKMHSTLMNSKVSKNIRNQGETLFCWAYAISTMLRQSLNLFIGDLINFPYKNEALKKLNSEDFHRQLRNELIMIPIPKVLSNEYIDDAPLSQGHYLYMALERVSLFHFHFRNPFFPSRKFTIILSNFNICLLFS